MIGLTFTKVITELQKYKLYGYLISQENEKRLKVVWINGSLAEIQRFLECSFGYEQ